MKGLRFTVEDYDEGEGRRWMIEVSRDGWQRRFQWIVGREDFNMRSRAQIREKARKFFVKLAHQAQHSGPRNARQRRRRFLRQGGTIRPNGEPEVGNLTGGVVASYNTVEVQYTPTPISDALELRATQEEFTMSTPRRRTGRRMTADEVLNGIVPIRSTTQAEIREAANSPLTVEALRRAADLLRRQRDSGYFPPTNTDDDIPF